MRDQMQYHMPVYDMAYHTCQFAAKINLQDHMQVGPTDNMTRMCLGVCKVAMP